MAAFRAAALAGSAASPASGNNTHTGVEMAKLNAQVAVEFVVDTAGATPTVTWKVQGSLDGTNYYDLNYVTDSTDTASTATRVATAVGNQVSFVANTGARAYRFYRVVTTSNTNITYHVILYAFDVRP